MRATRSATAITVADRQDANIALLRLYALMVRNMFLSAVDTAEAAPVMDIPLSSINIPGPANTADQCARIIYINNTSVRAARVFTPRDIYIYIYSHTIIRARTLKI